MATSRKRKKAVIKQKRELAGKKKFQKDVLRHQIKKVEKAQQMFEQLRAHQANTTGAQAEDVYSKIFNEEE